MKNLMLAGAVALVGLVGCRDQQQSEVAETREKVAEAQQDYQEDLREIRGEARSDVASQQEEIAEQRQELQEQRAELEKEQAELEQARRDLEVARQETAIGGAGNLGLETRSLTGVVQQSEGDELKVRAQDGKVVELKHDDSTLFRADGQPIKADQIKEGSQIRASYLMEGQELKATQIDVTQQQGGQ